MGCRCAFTAANPIKDLNNPSTSSDFTADAYQNLDGYGRKDAIMRRKLLTLPFNRAKISSSGEPMCSSQEHVLKNADYPSAPQSMPRPGRGDTRFRRKERIGTARLLCARRIPRA